MLEGVPQAAHCRQARRAAGGVQVHDLRAGLLLTELPDDAHIHLPQVPAGGDRPDSVFLVTTRTELARRAAVLEREPPSLVRRT